MPPSAQHVLADLCHFSIGAYSVTGHFTLWRRLEDFSVDTGLLTLWLATGLTSLISHEELCRKLQPAILFKDDADDELAS